MISDLFNCDELFFFKFFFAKPFRSWRFSTNSTVIYRLETACAPASQNVIECFISNNTTDREFAFSTACAVLCAGYIFLLSDTYTCLSRNLINSIWSIILPWNLDVVTKINLYCSNMLLSATHPGRRLEDKEMDIFLTN